MSNPANPQRLLAGHGSSDHLHPNDAGHAARAGAVHLGLFLLPAPAGQ